MRPMLTGLQSPNPPLPNLRGASISRATFLLRLLAVRGEYVSLHRDLLLLMLSTASQLAIGEFRLFWCPDHSIVIMSMMKP